jgi:hypothetical protein
MSYPSGHVANALVWYGVIALLLGALVTVPPRVHLAIRLVPPVIVFCTTTYLSFHWLTDSIAGLFLGLILTRLMARVPWDGYGCPACRTAGTGRQACCGRKSPRSCRALLPRELVAEPGSYPSRALLAPASLGPCARLGSVAGRAGPRFSPSILELWLAQNGWKAV